MVPYHRDTRMVVTTVNDLRIAMIVDGMEEIHEYEPDAVRRGVLEDDAHPGFLDRLTVRDGKVIQLVRIRNVLKDNEISMLRKH